MRLRVLACVALAAVLGAAPAAEAKKLPKGISYVRERVDRSNRVGAIVKHPPAKYSSPNWGSRFDQVRKNYPDRPLTPFILHQER